MTQPAPPTSPRHAQRLGPLALRTTVCAALAAGFAFVQIRRSQAAGRLSALPQYDDVTYMLQGLARGRVLREEGLLAFLRNTVEMPLWSPWGSLAATGGYAAFGLRPWAPYAVNGLLVFALLVLIDRLTRGAPVAVKLACWMLALALPLAAHTVADFRPDFATAFATATAILCILRMGATRSSWRAAVLAGVVAALALLAKPTVFAASVAYMGGAGLVMVGREAWRIGRQKPGAGTASIKSLAANIGVCAGVALLLITPQYALQHRAYWYYFSVNTFGDRASLWDRGLSGMENIGYFLTGPAGTLMFGPMLIPLAVIAIGGTAFALTRADRGLGWRLVQTWIAALACLALPATNATKNPYFGLVFGTLVLAIAVLGLRRVLEGLAVRASPRWSARTAMGLAVLLALPAALNRPRLTPGAAFNPTSLPGFEPAASNGTAERATDAIEAALEQAASYQRAAGDADALMVHFTGSGYLNKHTMAYMLMRRGHPRWKATDSAAFDDPVRLARGVALADVVIAFEPGFADGAGRSLIHDRFPGNQALGVSLVFARSDTGLTEVAAVPSPGGPAVVIFARQGRTSLRPKELRAAPPRGGAAAPG